MQKAGNSVETLQAKRSPYPVSWDEIGSKVLQVVLREVEGFLQGVVVWVVFWRVLDQILL